MEKTPSDIAAALSIKGDNTWEASHLCHSAACFNPNHIRVEGYGNNERRKAWGAKFGVCRCGLSPWMSILGRSEACISHDPATLR